MKRKAIPVLILLFSFFLAAKADAQQEDFNAASQLIQQQRFEEALPILRNLYENNPTAHIFFDKYVETLINLKRLDEARKITENQIRNNRTKLRASVRLAEIRHLSGEREKALETWSEIVEENENNIQIYYSIASSMMERREYESAIELYKKARSIFDNSTLFLNDLANAYMQAGRFEEAVNQFYTLIVQSPEQMGIVQQHFLRMRDDDLYEIAAFELEDKLMELDHNHVAYPQLYQLLTWLLLETEEYQRAFVMARQYEARTGHTVYSLFALGRQLKSAGEYQLAANSFQYYVDSSGSNRFRASEELADTYKDWAQYLQHNNLESPLRRNQLLEDAYAIYTRLLEEAPNYERADEVFTDIIELALDHFKDSGQAQKWYDTLRGQRGADESFQLYAEGRIAIFDENFTAARQALTRADRATDDSNLSEKVRYYLSMSDFYSGDHEFAGIQLRSLERRNTSFYANDAIKKRMWIQNGLRADSTGSLLRTLGEGFHAIHTGSYGEAFRIFEPVLAQPSNPFADVLTVELSSLLPPRYSRFALLLLERQLKDYPSTPQREKMLWNRALLAEQLLTHDDITQEMPSGLFEFLDMENLPLYTEKDLDDLYEQIIVEFPNGFYAPYSREKLQILQQTAWLP